MAPNEEQFLPNDVIILEAQTASATTPMVDSPVVREAEGEGYL